MARGPESDGEKRSGQPSREPSADGGRAGKRARVGEVLRRAYDEALAEPVPDAFADLLRKLD
ncbi:NepR family anti-sigma factor [Sphingoaurantiacus capsulatus]|uniref:NepR family anti-sigma factor n=1 Tax=Sphingoaurantiacus capsulatus TaxID=1771310 RepID=A0ABV7XD81_9SPHN